MRHARARGFTLIELLVTLAILGLLASMAMPMLSTLQREHKENELRQDLREIRAAIDAYKTKVDEGRIAHSVDASGYPPNLNVLWQGVSDLSRPDHRKIYFLRRLPRDPFYPDQSAPADRTWGLRCYESSPDDPQPGVDVYDVHSLSPQTGLNGVPYRDW
ncbi:MAG: type II secretion system protein [Betaproteobacteria bacterium]|nr:type II secretion system protein [Betaproteobacteria bacterium]